MYIFKIPKACSYTYFSSVSWIIEDLILEYANQIEEHMNKIVSTIQNNNWRTNPSVLAGMRVCLFRKGSNSLPTIITG